MLTKVFLASSSELLEDRKEFEIFIGRKNRDWVGKGDSVELVVWEDFLDAVSRTRLQDEYNKSIRDCDIFLMLFCTKVGQFTAEEFDTALEQFKSTGKPLIYTYFKDAEISTGSANKKDLMSLWAFQEKLEALGHFQTVYKHIAELKLHFIGQLDKLNVAFEADKSGAAASGRATHQTVLNGDGAIAQGGGTAVGAGGVYVGGQNTGNINSGTQFITNRHVTHFTGITVDRNKAKQIIAKYLDALVSDLAGLKLGEIDAAAANTRQSPLQLADIYVPLDIALHITEGVTLTRWLDGDISEADARKGMRPVSALEALNVHRKLTILGKPGSGKSTLGASVLLALARARQGHAEALKTLGGEWEHGPLLPVCVVLRRFAAQFTSGDRAPCAGDLWEFIGKDLDDRGYGLSADTMMCVQDIASTQGVLVLFDGLDECGSAAQRERVLLALQEFMEHAGAKSRFLLTARPYAFPGGQHPGQGVYLLADLNDGQIEQFIRAWYAALVTREWLSPGEAERKKEDLLQVRHRADLLPLAQNPLLLTLMATLHTNRGRLPDDRADLYGESVELLMLRWNRQIGADKALLDELGVPGLKLSDLREVLEELAFWIHERSSGQDGAADIGEDRLVRVFRPLLNSSMDKAFLVVEYIEKRAGLLLGQGEKDGERQFTFPHRTFQEFLAACHLASRDDLTVECARLARSAPAHWQVVLPLAARLARAERGASAADELIHGMPISEYRTSHQVDATDWACALLAGNQLLEIGMGAINKGERTRAIAKRVAGWLVASLPLHPDEGGAPAIQRAQAGDALSRLGDPRFDPQRFYLPDDDWLGFVHIPDDPEFCIGTRKANQHKIKDATDYDAHKDEVNEAPTPTQEFYIAKYPVTVAQFRAYAEATASPPPPSGLRQLAIRLGCEKPQPNRWLSRKRAREILTMRCATRTAARYIR
jgi:hypothetical protein